MRPRFAVLAIAPGTARVTFILLEMCAFGRLYQRYARAPDPCTRYNAFGGSWLS
jgi:hypothetical protein